jgi:hypothetical protein
MRGPTEGEYWREPTDREDYIGEYFYGDGEEELEFFDDDDDEQEEGETVLEALARRAADMKAGRAHPWPGWQLERPEPGILVWTSPLGQRRASTLTGEPLPLPPARRDAPGQAS